ncbi:hypothetical protein NOR_05212 [Metarhizium rileyi]|uniref:WW domain-containing protein n=1 Tax=Metarhizium rileyi (strain RCEF 4871) TaxID=1649241 RepID=A0A167CXR9_METRR|nr:hypothetical protein NOR_05212 [Metarhizium rileyi RCEF 4871]
MTGLPSGWGWDYDGKRWFYEYKPTGHVQYHFPSEGDEFPDFVEAGVPAPDLAPEERLESQQQIKRQTSSARSGLGLVSGLGSKGPSTVDPGHNSADKYGMSATAKPVSATWEGDDDAEADDVFQPENFMFLGPGTYADVSPLMEEEEEAAKRSVVGSMGERVQSCGNTEHTRTTTTTAAAAAAAAAFSRRASPLGSSKMTPMIAGSQPSASPAPVTKSALVIDSGPVMSQPAVQIESSHMIDGSEMPVEMMGDITHRFNPVGFLAEMPTEHTGAAHIELHPDPVEMGDNTILAPIETTATDALFAEMAELPAKHSPLDMKAPGEPNWKDGKKSIHGATIMTNDDLKQTSRPPVEDVKQYDQDIPKRQQCVPLLTEESDHSYGSQPLGQHSQQCDTIYSLQHESTQTSEPSKLEAFKIPRKQPAFTSATSCAQQSQQPAYQAYIPSQATTTAPMSVKRHSIGLQRQVSLMMNPKMDSLDTNPNDVPRVLSPPKNPAATAPSRSVRPAQPQLTENRHKATDFTKSGGGEPYLSQVPSVLRPASNRNSFGHLLPRSAPPQPGTRVSKGLCKVPSILLPARGRSPSEPGRGLDAAVQKAGESRALQHTATSPGSLQPDIQTHPVYPAKDSQFARPAQKAVVEQSWPTADAVQPERPASAMLIMKHTPYGSQYASACSDLRSQGKSHSQPLSTGYPTSALPSQSSPLQQMHDATASQPWRPQTGVGTTQVVSTNSAEAAIVWPQQLFSHQATTTQNVQNAVAGQPHLPRKTRIASSDRTNVGTHPLSIREKPQERSSTSAFQVQPLQHIQNAAMGRPLRPQNVTGTLQHSSAFDDSENSYSQGPGQLNSDEPTNSGMRRLSMSSPTPTEMAAIRPREDSQVSALGSPLPMDSARRGSASPISTGSSYTPSPLTDTAGPFMPNSRIQSTTPRQQEQSPPVPAKIRGHAEGFVLPIRNASSKSPPRDGSPIEDDSKAQQQQVLPQLSRPSHSARHAEKQLPQHGSPGQDSSPGKADLNVQSSAGQFIQEQTIQGQQRPEQAPQGQQIAGQMPLRMRPVSIAPEQMYMRQIHPRQMPLNTPSQGFVLQRPQSQPQGSLEMATQGRPNVSQPLIGHSPRPSNASQVRLPRQSVPGHQIHTRDVLQTQESEHNMRPTPPFAGPNRNRQTRSETQPLVTSKWAQIQAVDYSGGGWGDGEN